MFHNSSVCPLYQETSFSGNMAVTRKVSSTNVKSLPTKGTSQVVTVQRTQSESIAPAPPTKPANELSPWHVTSVAAATKPQGLEPSRPVTQRRVITTEL